MRMKKYFLIIALIFITGFNVKAANLDYYLSTKDLNYEYVDKNSIEVVNVLKGSYVYVTSVINNKDNILNNQLGKSKLTLRWDGDYLDLVEVNGKYYTTNFSNLSVPSINKSKGKLTIGEFTLGDTLNTGKNKLMEFKFQVLKTSKNGATKIYQMDGEDYLNCFDQTENKTSKCAESLYSEIKYNVQKSDNNKLAYIKLNNQELEYFNEAVLEYDIEVDADVDKINISAEKKDSSSVIGGDLGTKNLAYGINVFKINVISESGVTNTYTLNITRVDERSTVNTLKSLTLSDIDFVFNSNITEYNLDVNNKIDKVTITSTLTDNKSIYAEGFGNREVKLNEGSNKVLVKVLSESGEEKVYTFNITRALSGNNTLKSLMVNDKKINLNENEFIYNYEVETEIDEVVIKATPSDSKATINIKDHYELEVGENEINIDIVAPDGSKASYILNINRKKILSNNSNLLNIKIVGYKINFNTENTMYYLKIKDEDEKLDIYTVPEDTFATVTIEGNENLVDGSIIKINVKAEDGTYSRYFINIEKSRKNTLLPIIIIILVLLALLGVCIMLIIKRKKKEEAKKEEIQKKIVNEAKESDSLGEDINIEASDYDTNEEVPVDNMTQENTVEENNIDNKKDIV